MTTLIKNATIVDGTLKPPFTGDIFIKNDVISAIGNLGRQKAKNIINASQNYVSPGFIDVNTSSDHYLSLFSNPQQQDFLLQGVTTIFGGLCGSSLAPLMYGELISIRKWASETEKLNIDWNSVGEFLKVLERRGLGVNFGTLVGHSTIRRSLLSESIRDLTNSELDVFEKILQKSIKEGVYGLSTGLGYVHARNTPHTELTHFINVVSRHGGVYATHLRDEGHGLLVSIKETIDIAKETKSKVLINHLRPLIGYELEYNKAIQMLDESAQDTSIYFDLYPFKMSHVPIYHFLPNWAQNGGIEIMLKNVKNKSNRAQIISHLHFKEGGREITIASAPRFEYLEGKTLREFSEKRNISVEEGLLKLMELTSLKCTVLYENIDYELVKKTLAHKKALVSSNAESLPLGKFKSDRSTKTFTKFLDLVFAEKLLSIEVAIAKLTSIPASLYGLKNRGLLKEGMKADITIFSHNEKSGTEIEHVFVNGNHSVENKVLIGGRSGEILRKA
ncbi:MAG: amidohydrolase family protein [bacterium]|nr:amidohydrolase family protein [bacterium]